MKPERLEFCGINSFSEKAVVDFTRLSAGGIFGIFGDTGSGKTTILDSIVFALYGKVDRVRSGVAADMINYNCDSAYVVFDFETAEAGERRRFRVERGIRRKNSLQTLRLSEWKDGRLMAVADGVKQGNAAIAALVGISFEDFKKCIALPQGEFAQFVKADRSERLQLISRLFGLDKYGAGLNERIRERYAAVKSAFDAKEGELKGYADAGEEALSALRGQAAALAAERAELDKRFGLLQEEFSRMKEAREKYARYAALCGRREELLAREGEMNAVRAGLQRLAPAKEIAALRARAAVRAAEEKKASAARERARQESAEAAAFLQTLRESGEEAVLSAKLEACAAKLTAAGFAAKDAAEEASLCKEKEKAAAILSSAQRQLAARQAALQAARAKAEKAAAAAGGEEDIGAFLRGRAEGALLRGEYGRALRHFEEKYGELRRRFPPEGELYAWTERELASLVDYYRERTAQKGEDLSALLDEYRRRAAAREALQGAAHAAEAERIRAEAAVTEAETALRSAEEGARSVDARLQTVRARIREAVGEADPAAAVRGLQGQKKELSDALALLRKRAEDARGRASAADVETARAEALLQQYAAAAAEDAAALRAATEAGGFTREDEADEVIAAFPDAAAAEKRLQEHARGLLETEANLRLLSEGGVPPAVAEEEFLRAKEAFDRCADARRRAAEGCAVLESRCAELQRRLEVRRGLEREHAALKGRLDLVSRLRELVRGNNFMEFVASEYLADIAVQASGTLLHLTGGRYFIRYSQGFFIGDNLAGGQLRGVNTMSGGETFLVSLSLALALSAAIYAKSLKPIEFFFLDEGFGTLDEKLVELVIDSLEKLKNKHFTIGLISHIEELKHRIDHKIVVTGAAENGSSRIEIRD